MDNSLADSGLCFNPIDYPSPLELKVKEAAAVRIKEIDDFLRLKKGYGKRHPIKTMAIIVTDQCGPTSYEMIEVNGKIVGKIIMRYEESPGGDWGFTIKIAEAV